MEKLFNFLKHANAWDDETCLKICFNPEVLDDYFYITERKIHHLCILKEIFDDDFLFEEIIDSHRISEEFMTDKIADKACCKCTSFCSKNVSPFFNYVTYLVSINIQNKLNSDNNAEMKNLINHCFNLFSIKNNIYSFDFPRMWNYFADYDISQEDKYLSKNETIDNLEYLNELKDLMNTIEVRISAIHDKKIKVYNSHKKFIKNKEKYFDRKLIINEKNKKSGNNSSEIPFVFINNFDKVDFNKVYKYFNDSLVKKGYLSKEDLEKYLVLAFQDQKLPEEKFIFSKKHIGNITKIFHSYYIKISQDSYGKKKIYVQLLGGYFEGFENQKVYDNFAK